MDNVSCSWQISVGLTGNRLMLPLVLVAFSLGHRNVQAAASSAGIIHGDLFQQKHWGLKRNGASSILLQNGLLPIDGLNACLLFGDRLRGGSQEVSKKVDKKKEDKKNEEITGKKDEGEEEKEKSKTGDIDDTQEEEEEEEEEEEAEAVDESAELEETTEFDEPLVASRMLSFYVTIGIMVLSQKIDLFNPMVVRAIRFAFIGYILLLQAFLLYVRIKAKAEDNRTLVKLSNPVANLLQQQLQGPENSNAMVKNLASSFLSSESTVLEYDLKQAKGMQGGLMFTMCFMWLLHFKFQQIQPVLVQTFTGLINLFYSPLFQIYVLGRNLERPFKNPDMDRSREAMAQQAESTTLKATETTIDDETASTADDDDAEDEEDSEDEEDEMEDEEKDD